MLRRIRLCPCTPRQGAVSFWPGCLGVRASNRRATTEWRAWNRRFARRFSMRRGATCASRGDVTRALRRLAGRCRGAAANLRERDPRCWPLGVRSSTRCAGGWGCYEGRKLLDAKRGEALFSVTCFAGLSTFVVNQVAKSGVNTIYGTASLPISGCALVPASATWRFGGSPVSRIATPQISRTLSTILALTRPP